MDILRRIYVLVTLGNKKVKSLAFAFVLDCLMLLKRKKKRYLLSHAFGRLQRMRSLREYVVKTRYTKFPVMCENDAFGKK